jgi:beta-lactamase regulating signal transducer with metallopeptidase domain
MLLKLLVMPLLGYTLALDWLPQPTSRTLPPRAIPIVVDADRDIDRPSSAGRPVERIELALPGNSPPRETEPLTALGWPAWLLVAWVSVVLLQLVRLVHQRTALARALRGAQPAGAELSRAVADAAAALGLPHAPEALVTSREGSPFVCGVARPRMVISHGVLSSLAPAQLRQVLLHELAHVRRRDLLWGWVPEIARIVWWFHPVVHWVVFRLRLERELACDQLAIVLTGRDPADYAATLVHVAGRSSIPPAAAAAAALVAPATGGARAASVGETRGVNAAAKWINLTPDS